MCPIKGLTERQSLPRLGKIHLGVKVEKTNDQGEVTSTYPKACDFFVCPPEVQTIFGEQPRELRVMVPVEDPEQWCSQYYRAYSRTRSLTCKGDGETCRRLVDVKTGDIANRDSQNVEWRPMACTGKTCPDFQAKRCTEMMNLMFMLPEVPGLGVWQIDTTSINSIRNINASANFIRQVYGRIHLIPLILSLVQIEVVNPDDGKKKKVWVMKLGAMDSLFDVANRMAEVARRLPAGAELALPAPDDEMPDLLYPNGEAESKESDADKLWGEMGEHTRAQTEAAKATTKPLDTPVDTKPLTPIDKKPAEVPAVPKANADQVKTIVQLTKLGFDAAAKIKEAGWTATSAKALSLPQAKTLIEMAGKEGFTV